MNAVNLRFAEEKDMKSVLALIQELADFEKEPDAVVVTEADLKRDAFGEQPKFQCIVAEKKKHHWDGFVLSALLNLERPHFASGRFDRHPYRRGTGVGKAIYRLY